EAQLVERGYLGAPGAHVFDAAAELHFLGADTGGRSHGLLLAQHDLAARVENLSREAGGGRTAEAAHGHLGAELAVFVARVEVGVGEEVPNPHYLHRQLVVAGLEILRDVELGRRLGGLADAHALPIHIHKGAARNTAEVQHYLVPRPVGRHRKAAPVGTHRVIARVDEGLVAREGVGDVGVNRNPEALDFPVAGHLDGFPAGIAEAGLEEIHRPLGGPGHVVEFPSTVQALVPGRAGVVIGGYIGGLLIELEAGPRCLLALLGQLRVLPLGGVGSLGHGHAAGQQQRRERQTE
nr:hypothetical protein [Tanacetum cinerariifolium]